MSTLFFIVLFIVIGIALVTIKSRDVSYPVKFKKIGLASFGLAAMSFVIGSFTVIEPGYVGVPVTFGNVGSQSLPAGFHPIFFLTDVYKMSIQTKDYTMSSANSEGNKTGDDAVATLSRDQLILKFDVTVWYHLDPSQANNVYSNIGLNYEEVIVRPAIRTALVDAATKFDASDVMSLQRDAYTKMVTELLLQELAGKGVILDNVLIRNVEPPATVSDAIAAKLKAAQQAQQMEYTIQYAQKEAQRKAIEAQGIADAQRIINNGLTQNYLQWYYISQLKELVNSPNNSTIILPYDQKLTPLLNVQTKK
ncbi:MAG TPA: prohibitin family protein [Candidatus Acidoferrales bacterium]|nr:prohibitin family protein [Candidatus Acidoferrales bacterium]